MTVQHKLMLPHELTKVISKGWNFHSRTKDGIDIFRQETRASGVEHYGFHQDGFWYNVVTFFNEEEILAELIKDFRLRKKLNDNWKENSWRLHEQNN